MVIHTVGVGASLRNNPSFRDVQVTGIDCPDRMMLGNLARVTGSIEAIGLGGHVVQACLDEDGRQIAQTELTLDPTGNPQQVAFDFRPTTKGRHSYTVRVPPVAGERIVENNQRSAVASVDQAQLHVLYIEGTLRAEYGALVDRFLAKDPDLGFCALVQTRPNVFLRRTNMPELRLAAIPSDQAAIDKFEVFILGDLDSIFLRPAQQEMLLKRIRAGAGLVMLGGYHSLGPGGYADTPLGRALPVELGDRQIGQFTEPLLPVLTPEGRRHPIFANIDQFFPTQQGPAEIAGAPAAGRLHARRAGPARRFGLGHAHRPRQARCRCWPSRRWIAAGWPSLPATRRATGSRGPSARPRVALRAFLGPDGPLAGRPVGNGRSAKRASPSRPTRPPTTPASRSISQPSCATRTAKAPPARRSLPNSTDPTAGHERIALSPVSGPSGHYAGVFEPRASGRYEISVACANRRLGPHLGEADLRGRPAPHRVREARPRR